ncbi:MAG: sulfate ABC transporter ATP-binding protein [Wolinella succinogenes]|uniref:sulfate/molybdate ABC transporter ATP-binding protein n=1 Tax=Wolinella succinogenes TaxID=844 RepID=UPI0016BD6200|nr:sulfate ABC transporter ATP-binding protein [Wolinella succinogenes]NLU34275.1 sulfate ABC transporter ATP-binding protein [Wolinella succinogenes]
MSIEISNIHKRFGSFLALEDINLSIPNGELTALLGPSGSGKTTLLRIIAGLESPDSGHIGFFGEDSTHKHTKDRQVGFVFQHYALFKHMSVFENVAFGLRVRPKKNRPSEEEIAHRVHHLLHMVQLQAMANRLPSELSGGQKQRVALARALAVEPKVLLLDEPFGALDAKVRQELRRWLRKLHDEINVTSVFVTHDQEEALEVSDKIVVMNQGKIEQVGTPEEVYDKPSNPFVYGFLGSVNLFHARVNEGSLYLGGTSLQTLDESFKNQEEASLFVRPHEVLIESSDSRGSGIKARILTARSLGARVRVELESIEEGKFIEADIDKESWNQLKKENPSTVFVRFLGAKIYSQNDTWSHYVI